jgi:hypothetical protein
MATRPTAGVVRTCYTGWMGELAEWDSFYVIVGSAAGALVGLQFVVMTLIAQRPPRRRSDATAGAAFGTPTVVHFGAALLLSALLRAPWHAMVPIAALWGAMGVVGAVYVVVVARRMRAQDSYRPQLEDWLFHAVLPCVAYVALAAAASRAVDEPRDALFAVGGAALLLLFVGIHNAWDSVAYHVLVVRPVDE